MSIVYDYLKQIKDKKEPAKEPAKDVPQVKPKTRLAAWIKIAIVLLVCMGVGLAVYVFAPRVAKPTVKLYHAPVADVSGDVSNNVPMMRSAEAACVLEGIIYNPSRPFAIINGKMLEKGGQIGDFEVTRITPDSVALKNLKDGTSRTIRL